MVSLSTLEVTLLAGRMDHDVIGPIIRHFYDQGTRRDPEPFNSTPMAASSNSSGSARTYAPRGCIVRVASQTKA